MIKKLPPSFVYFVLLLVVSSIVHFIAIQNRIKIPEIIQIYKRNWRGHCSFPNFVPQKMQAEPWFPLYLSHLQRVNISVVSVENKQDACMRWWYPTPRMYYHDHPPPKFKWQPKPQPKPGYIRPNCTFAQKLVPRTKCATKHEVLWRILDNMGALYYPRSGSELGVLRGSKYLRSDGDLDIFVDMPQEINLYKLKKVLSPPPVLSGEIGDYNSEVHWILPGCPSVHMVFSDWMNDELVNEIGNPSHVLTCTCMMNSVKLPCHKEALRRIWVMYGPSWRVPLNAKQLDVPWASHGYNIVGKLNSMASYNLIIYEQTVRALDPSIVYDEEEMDMILAQLNILKASINSLPEHRMSLGF